MDRLVVIYMHRPVGGTALLQMIMAKSQLTGIYAFDEQGVTCSRLAHHHEWLGRPKADLGKSTYMSTVP